jgi:hypothetical protein
MASLVASIFSIKIHSTHEVIFALMDLAQTAFACSPAISVFPAETIPSRITHPYLVDETCLKKFGRTQIAMLFTTRPA